MASGSAFWAVALASDPVRKMAVSTAFVGNDTVMLRYGCAIIASQRAAANAPPTTGFEQSIVVQAETWIVRRSAPSENVSRLSQAVMWKALGDGALRRRHRLGQVLRDLVEEAGGGEPALVGPDQKR